MLQESSGNLTARYYKYKSFLTTTDAPACGTGQRWNWCVKGCVPKASLMPDCPPPTPAPKSRCESWQHQEGDQCISDLPDINLQTLTTGQYLPWLLAGAFGVIVLVLLVTRK